MTYIVFFFFSFKLVPLTGHEDAVNYVKFDMTGSYLLSGGSDNILRIWS